ncbi:MAG: endopeptidase La [Clostridium baratii]|uniref:endopeptidase La n=1 Tax=Clostridium baratii TaxID=1561 RepID=UPI0022E46033|nr:endopeptidase La [Clostridium baratii]MBS6005646.1 endopeptidase La [Clostridium baratii]MDU1052712.1 endopeptidase La [Clostridium baratii]MDU4910207.1 endopeptidase La [Clostridium baratii]MDY3206756.1 endopeptidase La [Clostridium baratii]
MTNENILPLIPLRGMTIFPNMVTHFDVGREKSKKAVEAAMENGEKIFLATQKDVEIEDPKKSDISKVGTICNIKQIIKLPDDIIRVLVEGKERAVIKKYQPKKSYLEVELERIKEDDINDVEIDAYVKSLKEKFIKLMKVTGENSSDIVKAVELDNKIYEFIDMVSSVAIGKEEDKQEILETIDLKERISKLLVIIEQEIEIASIQKKIAEKVKTKIDKSQKEYFLREQIKAIQEELGEDDENKLEIKKYEEKIESAKLPKEVKEKAVYELNRLKSNSSTSEEGVIRSYLDWILDMPWNKKSKDTIDIKSAEKVLNKEHYGLNDVKERIIEYLAVKQVSKSMKGPILCLVGPPGVGKTSIAKSIAESMNRKYARIALGGMKDESEIRGHRKTYVGAIPGRIAYALREAKTSNPLILLDEIDKISSNYKGDPQDALLEVLDSEQNYNFRDNYLELPLDLSKTFFIATANSLDTIPRALLDRMEVIEVSGYTYEEKFQIAKRYLLKKELKEHNISEDKIKVSDSALKEIIEGYTRESGVRSLTRVIAALIRKSITEMLKKNKDSISINSKKVENLLGKKIFSYEKIDKEDKIGVVTGMAWTAYGGDTLPVEAMVMDGTGKLQLTGQLGDVMQESAKAAFTYVRANAAKYGIDSEFYKNKDIHIHVPEGAVPKDGPSAGVTMVTALVSALSKKKVRHNVAMTGEVTLTGRVLPIGGLKEKSLAAVRAGIDTIIVPKENEKDADKIPASIKKGLKIILAEQIDTVLDNAIIGEDTHEN